MRKEPKSKKVEEPKATHSYQLGDNESMDGYEAGKEGSGGIFKIDYSASDNIFALVSPAWLSVQEHWIKIGDDRHKLVCAVHLTNDAQKILNKWGYPDGCPFCAFKQQIFEGTEKEDKDPTTIAKRDIAKDISSKLTNYMYAMKGVIGTSKRIRGERIITPTFEDNTVKKLALSRDAFDQFLEEFRKQGLNTVDAFGIPVNFITGTKGNQTIPSVQRIEFYPKYNAKKQFDPLPLPPKTMFGNLDKYDEKVSKEVFTAFEEAFEDIVVGKVAGSKQRSAGKKGKKK